jgi:hypothetical protein
MIFKERVDKIFQEYGESIMINGTTSAKGFIQPLDHQRMLSYFDSTEESLITRPGLIAMVPADTSAAVDDTIARDGRTYEVKKIFKQRIGDTVMMQTLVLV